MEISENYANILIKGGQLVKPERIDIFKKYVLLPNLNSFVDMELALSIMEAKKNNNINEESLEGAISKVVKNTYDNEVWKVQPLSALLVYTEGMLYNFDEKELGDLLHNYLANNKADVLFEKIKSELGDSLNR